jgi:translation elongation factor EF-1beta
MATYSRVTKYVHGFDPEYNQRMIAQFMASSKESKATHHRCIKCLREAHRLDVIVVLTACGHFFCFDCFDTFQVCNAFQLEPSFLACPICLPNIRCDEPHFFVASSDRAFLYFCRTLPNSFNTPMSGFTRVTVTVPDPQQIDQEMTQQPVAFGRRILVLESFMKFNMPSTMTKMNEKIERLEDTVAKQEMELLLLRRKLVELERSLDALHFKSK